MTSGDLANACEQVAPLLVFYACGELDDREQALVQQHLTLCAACSAQLSEEKNLQTLLPSPRTPTGWTPRAWCFRNVAANLPKHLTIWCGLRFWKRLRYSARFAAGWRCAPRGAAPCWW